MVWCAASEAFSFVGLSVEDTGMGKVRTSILAPLVIVMLLITAGSASAKNESIQQQIVDRALLLRTSLLFPRDCNDTERLWRSVLLAAAQLQIQDHGEVINAFQQASAAGTFLPTSDTSYSWNGAGWDPTERTTQTYSVGGRWLTMMVESYEDPSWQNSFNLANTYDGNGRLIETVGQLWNDTTSQWANFFRTTSTYLGSGNPSEIISYGWTGSAWVNSTRSTFTYNGNLPSTQTTQMWAGASWVNSHLNTYTYNGSGFVTEDVYQDWTGVAWVNNRRETVTYTGQNNIDVDLTQTWSGSAWTNYTQAEHSYDGQGNEILLLNSTWSPALSASPSTWTLLEADTSRYANGKISEKVMFTPGSFASLARYLYTYEGDTKETSVYQIYFFSTWSNSTRDVTIYGEYQTAVMLDPDPIPNVYQLSQNYPNPFNPSTVIQFSLLRGSEVRVTVYNLLGETVRVLENEYLPPGRYETTWDGDDATGQPAASGMYFYRLNAGNYSETRKMLLMK